jgi:hypothetical protein
MMASEYAETCHFINTNKTGCVLSYFTLLLHCYITTGMPQLKKIRVLLKDDISAKIT